jgi:hypothetical protein
MKSCCRLILHVPPCVLSRLPVQWYSSIPIPERWCLETGNMSSYKLRNSGTGGDSGDIQLNRYYITWVLGLEYIHSHSHTRQVPEHKRALLYFRRLYQNPGSVKRELQCFTETFLDFSRIQSNQHMFCGCSLRCFTGVSPASLQLSTHVQEVLQAAFVAKSHVGHLPPVSLARHAAALL